MQRRQTRLRHGGLSRIGADLTFAHRQHFLELLRRAVQVPRFLERSRQVVERLGSLLRIRVQRALRPKGPLNFKSAPKAALRRVMPAMVAIRHSSAVKW